MTSSTASITIRPAYAGDGLALTRLAALDSSEVPCGRLIIAEVDGIPRVALSVDEMVAIADPFHPSADLVALLRDHVQRLRSAEPDTRRRSWPSAGQLRRRLRVA